MTATGNVAEDATGTAKSPFVWRRHLWSQHHEGDQCKSCGVLLTGDNDMNHAHMATRDIWVSNSVQYCIIACHSSPNTSQTLASSFSTYALPRPARNGRRTASRNSKILSGEATLRCREKAGQRETMLWRPVPLALPTRLPLGSFLLSRLRSLKRIRTLDST